MSVFIKKIMFPIFLLIAVFLIILRFISDVDATNNIYTLKAYKNTVALYDGEEIIDIYNNIVLNTLPQKDIQSFKSGIHVASPKHAEIYLEDFDN